MLQSYLSVSSTAGSTPRAKFSSGWFWADTQAP